MKRYSQQLCYTVALSLCVSQLFAQQVYLKLPTSGPQSWHPVRKWQGLDLKQFFGSSNAATGTGALTSCTSCAGNVADGYSSLNACTSCGSKVGVGSWP
jgi:hypothetical protein